MIGLLIISHSAAIARGVKELADQMAKGQVRIAAAGGTHDGGLGTSADLIVEALEQLKGVSAVLTLVDMGSAVMSAEMALELSGETFLISGAPLVEGALVAAVEAMRPDATLEHVAAAAARALEAKGVDALPAPRPAPAADEMPLPADPVPPGPAAEVTLTVINKVGLHMRPAKEFVQAASRFVCTVRVRNLDRPERPDGNAKSMIDVMKLGVASGQRVHVRAEGDDAVAAVDALRKLVADNFGEA
ncbi:MAG: PTS-dependent dihydroxyacetone kinase phosphotransferase subunit DhaM [Chloroflexales bacterium]|nr:PTS-dependent dihydroxyacetone kinase phosphotransferase subunit DhaM [Chloroflexales bacterium]